MADFVCRLVLLRVHTGFGWVWLFLFSNKSLRREIVRSSAGAGATYPPPLFGAVHVTEPQRMPHPCKPNLGDKIIPQ